MPRSRGYTLIELMLVVAIVGILAAVTVSRIKFGTRNASLSSATYEFVVRLGGVRATAMSEGKDYLVVFADAPGSDATGCSWGNSDACSRYYVLSDPTASWSLSAFDPAHPGANAALVDWDTFPRGVHLDLAQTFTPPPPFSGIVVHDSDLRATCGGTRTCFAIRYTRLGGVAPVYAGGSTTAKQGFGFVLATDLSGGGGDRRGVSVAYPSGIVKTVTF